MKRIWLIFIILFCSAPMAFSQKKLTKAEKANLTPEQRMVYDNSKKRKLNKNQPASVKDKVKKAKKEDRSARRTKAPKRAKRPSPRN